MRHLGLISLALCLMAVPLTAQSLIHVPDNAPASGTCNIAPWGYAAMTYVARIPVSFLDPANPTVDDVGWASCNSNTFSAPDVQIGMGHVPNPLPIPFNFPLISGGAVTALGDFLDLTVVWDSALQGPSTWPYASGNWSDMGLAGTGGTGFTWNGVNDIAFYVTFQNATGISSFHRTGTEPFRAYQSSVYQSSSSTTTGASGLKMRLTCVPGGGGPFTLAANNTPSTGDLQLALTNIPGTTTEGYTLLSTNVSGPVGLGSWGGLYPDPITLTIISLVPIASPGDPLHWTWPVASPLYPADNANFPPGSFPAVLYGLSWDFMALAVDGSPATLSNVERVNW
jgi:hypothetical protein